MPKKVLIIYEKMGMGHLRMANILEDILKTEGEVEVIKYAGSEILGSSDMDIIVNLWNFLIKKNLIRTADILLNFIIRITGAPILEAINTPTFMQRIDEINPDIIICTADGYNKVLGTYAKERKIPFYIVITEVSVFIDLVNPYATHICYFNETGEAIRNYDFDMTYFSYKLNKESTLFERIQYVLKFYNDYILHAYKNSIYRNPDKYLTRNNDAKYEVIGPLAERKHFSRKNVKSIKEKYGIPSSRDTVLIASGSIGGKFLMEMTDIICKGYEKPLNLLVMCGRDKITYEKMKTFKNKNSLINIIPFGYTDRFDEFLAASDCLIARPSAGIFIESLLNGTPEITFSTATSNDKGALTMIEKYKMGEVCDSKKELLSKLNKILENKEEYKSNIERLLFKYTQTYEDKKSLIRSIILEGHSAQYEDDREIESEPVPNTMI